MTHNRMAAERRVLALFDFLNRSGDVLGFFSHMDDSLRCSGVEKELFLAMAIHYKTRLNPEYHDVMLRMWMNPFCEQKGDRVSLVVTGRHDD